MSKRALATMAAVVAVVPGGLIYASPTRPVPWLLIVVVIGIIAWAGHEVRWTRRMRRELLARQDRMLESLRKGDQ